MSLLFQVFLHTRFPESRKKTSVSWGEVETKTSNRESKIKRSQIYQTVGGSLEKTPVDLTADESTTEPIDLSTTVGPDPVSFDSSISKPAGGGVTRRNFTNEVSIFN